MELPSALNKKITALLAALPDINAEKGQQQLLSKASLDARLRKGIPMGKPAAFFVPLLVRRLADHGRLKDGRHALEAVLEAAHALLENTKQQKNCAKLLEHVRTLAQEQPAEKPAQPRPAGRTSSSAYVRLTLDQKHKNLDRRRRKDLESKLAELLALDRQFVTITDAESENSAILIRLPAEQARTFVVLFQAKHPRLASFREQFAAAAILNPLREIALLSDTKLLPDAESFLKDFFKEHSQMTDRRNQITATQIKGLENVLASAETTQLLSEYLKRQRDKAKRNENPYHKNKEYYLARFYEELERQVDDLGKFVGRRADIFPDATQSQRYHYLLVQEFLQHLIIDYTFRVQVH